MIKVNIETNKDQENAADDDDDDNNDDNDNDKDDDKDNDKAVAMTITMSQTGGLDCSVAGGGRPTERRTKGEWSPRRLPISNERKAAQIEP